mmetsp:Transcript_42778/g.167167  ORF Transcript_42778/g.167167 Transcript_42778/m.167167 type:complete len:203 (-) Transcript_42778:1774-2382(-)
MNALIELFFLRIPSPPAAGAPEEAPVFFLLRSTLGTSVSSFAGVFASSRTISRCSAALGSAADFSLAGCSDIARFRFEDFILSAAFAASSSAAFAASSLAATFAASSSAAFTASSSAAFFAASSSAAFLAASSSAAFASSSSSLTVSSSARADGESIAGIGVLDAAFSAADVRLGRTVGAVGSSAADTVVVVGCVVNECESD